MPGRRRKITVPLSALEGLSFDQLDALFEDEEEDEDGITFRQAYNSDCGGDSEADDDKVNESETTAANRRLTRASLKPLDEQDDQPMEMADILDLDESPKTPLDDQNDFGGYQEVESALQSNEIDDSRFPAESDPQPRNFLDIMENEEETAEPQDQEPEVVTTNGTGQNADEQPYEPNWTRDTANSKKTFEETRFREPFGPNIPVDISNPMFIFLSLIGNFLPTIVQESNLYAQQNGQNLQLTIEELKAFLGILIIMGFHNLPSMKLYWSARINFRVERIASAMPKRFLKIMRYLNLKDNSLMPDFNSPNFDKLYKLRPMIDFLNDSFHKAFNPSRYISVDESMVAFKGRSSLKQYVPLKPIKRGFKIWAACCSVTGYLLQLQMYQGKLDSIGGNALGLGERVVLHLTQLFVGKGYCVFFDRFFFSVKLVLLLLPRKIFACGTILSTRKFFPSTLKTDGKMGFGESDFTASENLGVARWRDRGKKCVNVISSFHDLQKKRTVTRRDRNGVKQKVKCPAPIKSYNDYMGGVDRFDQLQAAYSISWKSRRWWMKVFYYLVDATIINSFILMRECSKLAKQKVKFSHLLFRDELANQLMAEYLGQKQKSSPRPVTVSKAKFYRKLYSHTSPTSNHEPVVGKYRRCARCSSRKKPKKSNLICSSCNVALCKSCFTPYHKDS